MVERTITVCLKYLGVEPWRFSIIEGGEQNPTLQRCNATQVAQRLPFGALLLAVP